MILTPLVGLAIAALVPSVYSQDIEFDAPHNATPIIGTWSSGSKNVLTGPGFANPANMSFEYPKTTGVSYSFSDDGFYEIARYRFNGNGSEPTCITGVIGWVHGTYALLNNGSIIMTPMGDGFQQVQDPCAAISNFIEPYNITETYHSWRIFEDATAGPKLHLFQFDGAPLAPQFQVSTTPRMLPTQKLRSGGDGRCVVGAVERSPMHVSWFGCGLPLLFDQVALVVDDEGKNSRLLPILYILVAIICILS